MRVRPTKMTYDILFRLSSSFPSAYALIKGNDDIKGNVMFYDYHHTSLILYQIENLPKAKQCEGGIFAFHIHNGDNCDQPLDHFNPNDCPHPYHLGDLPPLFTNNGIAWGLIMIDKFEVEDVINRTLIIHENVDDFKTQPSGNPGDRIACGVIKKFEK